jgi:hypothetical protein
MHLDAETRSTRGIRRSKLRPQLRGNGLAADGEHLWSPNKATLIEIYPREQVAEAYAFIMTRNAQFRVVLTM